MPRLVVGLLLLQWLLVLSQSTLTFSFLTQIFPVFHAFCGVMSCMNHTRAGTAVSSPEAEMLHVSFVLSRVVLAVQQEISILKGIKSVNSYSHE